MPVTIPTEPIGSIPRPLELIAEAARSDGAASEALYENAVKDTVERFEATGSPVITDGEGHTRRLPRLTQGPLRYARYADSFLDVAQKYAHVPVKQAVISPSALSLMYPPEGIRDYPREQFIADLLDEHETEIRRCLAKGAHKVQIDFTEGRLAVKIDPSGKLLNSFIELNNLALHRFSSEDRKRLGVHTCPGGDRDSTHSAEVDYEELLPSLFQLEVGNFYLALAGEKDRSRVQKIIRSCMKPDQRIFVGVIAPINPHVETPSDVCDRVLEAAKYIPADQLGTTDDCGFSPFSDDTSTSRDVAFAKIAARVAGTEMASKQIGLGSD
jgi:5-methyltetrahydropteroyltriglutamate--homocysteine methyltransferase